MENPKCPYCGGEMVEDNDRNCIGELLWYYKCTKCSSISPPYWKDRERAYAAAMKRDRAKGEWGKPIWGRDNLDRPIIIGAQCFVCKKTNDFPTPYCPNCGADMRKEV